MGGLTRRLGAGLLLMGVVLTLHGCAPARRDNAALPELSWPEAPAPARIAYAGAFRGPADLGIEKSLWQRIGEFFSGSREPRMVRPMAILGSADGERIYVADPGVRGVHRFDLRAQRYTLLHAEGTALVSPVALAEGPTGQILLADSGLARLFVLQAGAKRFSPFELSAPLTQPTGVVFDAQGTRIFVTDTAEHCIKIFSAQGEPLGRFGQRGNAEGAFNYPTGLWRDKQGRLFVTDAMNFRIQWFTPEGAFLGAFGRPGDASGSLSRPKGVASDNQGHLYVVDALFHAFQIFDETGTLLLKVGAQGRGAGEFWLPTGIYIAPDDTIYVADSHNQRVQRFRYLGGTP